MGNVLREKGDKEGYEWYEGMGLFRDRWIWIGWKGCEVGCKEWKGKGVGG